LALITVRSKSITGVVSAVLLLPCVAAGSPPPLTLAVLVTCGAAVLITLTGKVTVVDVLPGVIAVDRVQEMMVPPATLVVGDPAGQDQVASRVGAAASVRPAGRVSVSVYVFVPVVRPPEFVTLRV
jgi:hypothetical protein